MAGDYHPKTEQNDSIASFQKDTSMMTNDPHNNTTYCYYIHRFHLFDILARGNVRQLFICYLCRDVSLVTNRFAEFIPPFKKAVELLKKGNISVAKSDICKRLVDLTYTYEKMTEDPSKRTTGGPPSQPGEGSDRDSTQATTPPNEIKSSITDLERILKWICSVTNCLPPVPAPDYTPEPIWRLNKIEGKLRPIEVICGPETVATMKNILKDIFVYFSRPHLVLAVEDLERQFLRPQATHLALGKQIGCNFDVDIFEDSTMASQRSTVPPISIKPTPLAFGPPLDEEAQHTKFETLAESPFPALSVPHFINSAPPLQYQTFANLFLLQQKPGFPYPPGTNLLALSRNVPEVKHIIYSLLKGRTVVVCGKDMHTVEAIVLALAIFVCGVSDTICTCRSNKLPPLHIPDLSTLRLVGVLSAHQYAPVKENVSLFLLDTKEIIAPRYPEKAVYIDDILFKHEWPDDPTFISHVHRVLLNIANRAFLYYHLCCVAISQLTVVPEIRRRRRSSSPTSILLPGEIPVQRPGELAPNQSSASVPNFDKPFAGNNPHPAPRSRQANTGAHKFEIKKYMCTDKKPTDTAEREQACTDFFKKYCICDGDKEILINMAEVVKKQQAQELHPTMSLPCKLDLSPCTSTRFLSLPTFYS
ncbi:guanine nucleotide exchange protein SMCR8 [Pelomyxa schiedti]|nr:guanine nucleotide exchange protein SMCR8 [Pelomyxa schiedti]